MANRVVKYYFGVQNFPKGRAWKNYVQAKRWETSVNFVNKAFLSFSGPEFWLKGDSFFKFAKKYLLKFGKNNGKNRKRLNPKAAGAYTPNKTCRSNLFVIRHFVIGRHSSFRHWPSFVIIVISSFVIIVISSYYHPIFPFIKHNDQ